MELQLIDGNYNEACEIPEGAEEVREVDVQVEIPPRERWNSKAEFLLATIGYVVGYVNFWRFPYLCYRNGGALFLFPYFLMLLVIGIPLFFMELSIGQWYSRGYISLWKAVCPLASGLGYGLLALQYIYSMYYIVFLAWIFFYLFDSFRSELPWSCYNHHDKGNTPYCRMALHVGQTINCTALDLPVNCIESQVFTPPSVEYWNNRVLHITDSINDMGGMRWELVGTLLLSWVLVYVCIFKGIKLTGKVVYFTAVFPLLVILVMLVRGLTLEGAYQGISQLFVNHDRFADPKEVVRAYADAGTQIVYSLEIGIGGVMTFASFNNFKNNVHRDTLIITLSNCLTSIASAFVVSSIVGFLAYVLKIPFIELMCSGPGLVFIVFPEAISQLPLSVFWSILFFFMLATLGLGTMFGAIEAIVTAIIDENPELLRRRKWLVVLIVGVTMFLFALMFCMDGGDYLLVLWDSQSSGISLLFCILCENIFIAWIYGIDRFCTDVEVMTGRRPFCCIRFSLKWISPIIILALLLAHALMWNGIKYKGEPYPDWAEFVGWCICLVPILIFVGMAAYIFWKTPGSLRERWAIVTTPDAQVLAEIEREHAITRNTVHIS